MTVGELIDKLTSMIDTEPQFREQIVILSSDAEGNSKSPLCEISPAMYVAETSWSGEVYLTPEQLAAESGSEFHSEAPDDAVRCLVLYPAN